MDYSTGGQPENLRDMTPLEVLAAMSNRIGLQPPEEARLQMALRQKLLAQQQEIDMLRQEIAQIDTLTDSSDVPAHEQQV
jgi:hypothetical protein